MFNKISVGLDGSKSSLNALNYAIHLAKQNKSELLLISAVEPITPIATYPGGVAAYMPQIEQDIIENTNNMQKKQLDRLKKAYPDLMVKGVVKEGRAANVIHDNSKDSDLIVIGHRGHGGVLSWILGSVAKEVVDKCTVPVLVVKDKNYL